MKKKLFTAVLAFSAAALIGISLPLGITGRGWSPTCAFAATKKSGKKPKPGKKDSVKIDQLNWSVSEGVVDGVEMMTFEYDNKSSFDIAQFTIQFEPKGELTDEQKLLFTDVFDEEEATHDYSTLKMCITHGDYVANAQQNQYDLMEPSVATIAYLGGDGKIYLEYYSFKSKTYTTSSKGGVKAYDWPTKALAKSLPKPDCPIVYTSLDEKAAFRLSHLASIMMGTTNTSKLARKRDTRTSNIRMTAVFAQRIKRDGN